MDTEENSETGVKTLQSIIEELKDSSDKRFTRVLRDWTIDTKKVTFLMKFVFEDKKEADTFMNNIFTFYCGEEGPNLIFSSLWDIPKSQIFEV